MVVPIRTNIRNDQYNIKHYQTVDIIRLLCACSVVLMHCLEIKEGHPIAHMIVTCFSQQAVPYFFIVSGFFFSKKISKSDSPLHETVQCAKSYLALYATWMMIEIPYLIPFYIKDNAAASVLYVIALIVRRLVFAGLGVYWYLLVLAEAVLVIGFFIKKKKENILYFLAIVGLTLGFIYDANISFGFLGTFNSFIYFVFSWSNNLLMKGLPYATIGVFLSKSEKYENLSKCRLLTVYTLLSIAFVAVFAICYCYNKEAINFLYLQPAQAVVLFLIALQPSTINIKKKICNHFRDLSATIYYVHTIFIYNIIDKVWDVNSPVPFKFIVAFSLSVVVYCVAKALKFKPLLWLLSIKH